MRTIVSGFISPQVSRNATLPLRAIRPEAPASRPASTCSRMMVLIRFNRSLERPICSGEAVGSPPPSTRDKVRQKTSRIRMTADCSTHRRPDTETPYRTVGRYIFPLDNGHSLGQNRLIFHFGVRHALLLIRRKNEMSKLTSASMLVVLVL